jgi:hypothetical protein
MNMGFSRLAHRSRITDGRGGLFGHAWRNECLAEFCQKLVDTGDQFIQPGRRYFIHSFIFNFCVTVNKNVTKRDDPIVVRHALRNLSILLPELVERFANDRELTLDSPAYGLLGFIFRERGVR